MLSKPTQSNGTKQGKGEGQAKTKGGKSCPGAPLGINQLSKGGPGGCAADNGR
ncbi:uncharacterized protein TrAFT101_004308 [Trichoderma asperellum]|uniref:uncharacterized protein n=1 Tax=Trichoderma asperellum TaxID=101201 RepID=UPI0033253B70|nr:hypothetical protein TrAFT101_004308 [Trichoderma asperellum]